MKKWALLFIHISLYPPVTLAAPDSPQSQATDLAIKILAKRNDVTLDKIQVDSVKAVKWPDSSLGCPQPGMMYMQVVTPGFLVKLLDLSKSTIHFVHVGPGRAVVCDKTAGTRTQTDKNLRFHRRWQLSQKAQKLLAGRLSVTHNEVRIVGNRNIPADKLPARCKSKAASTHTQIIELSYKNKVYRYGVINDNLIACD